MSIVTPRNLYKYRAVNADALAMLASDKLYLSRLDAFNDPFEVLSRGPTLETTLAADEDGHFAVTQDAACQGSLSTRLRVCSFSEDCQDLLMWGHYADSHRGFCIQFDFEKDSELAELLHPIRYSESISESTSDQNELQHVLRRSLEKSVKWEYEREWRIVRRLPAGQSPSVDFFANYRPEALTGITFGVRLPEPHKELIRTILGGRDVKYLQAEKRRDNFALTLRGEGAA